MRERRTGGCEGGRDRHREGKEKEDYKRLHMKGHDTQCFDCLDNVSYLLDYVHAASSSTVIYLLLMPSTLCLKFLTLSFASLSNRTAIVCVLPVPSRDLDGQNRHWLAFSTYGQLSQAIRISKWNECCTHECQSRNSNRSTTKAGSVSTSFCVLGERQLPMNASE